MKQFSALFDLILRTQFNRARAAALASLGAIGVLIAFVLGVNNTTSYGDRVRFIDAFGLGLVLPVGALIFASASIGDLIDDQTLVYLTMRPVNRAKIAFAAFAASLSIVVPLVAIPLVAAAAAARLDADAIIATVVATGVGAFAYTGLFCALGTRLRRALTAGLIYVFIWEQFVARASRGVRRWTVSAYTRTILKNLTDVRLRDADMNQAAAIIIPLVVGCIAMLMVVRWLQTRDIA